MTIMTQAQVISRWHQEGESCSWLQWQRIGWGALFLDCRILSLHSEQIQNRPWESTEDRFFPLPVWQPGWRSCTPQKDRQPSPRSSEIMSWAILGSSFHLWPQVFLFFSFSFFFASFWDYSSQHTLNRRLSGRFRDECVLNCLFIGG